MILRLAVGLGQDMLDESMIPECGSRCPDRIMFNARA
jgi:hypothetical protein